MARPIFPSLKATVPVLLLIACIALSAPASAEDFACGDPPFGTPMSELDENDFVKFAEQDGISYYNYTGHCRLTEHERGAASVVFAFIKDKLYARLVWTREDKLRELTRLANIMFGPPKIYEEGDWYILSWKDKQNMRFKAKFNKRTRESKSALYYMPLKKELESD